MFVSARGYFPSAHLRFQKGLSTLRRRSSFARVFWASVLLLLLSLVFSLLSIEHQPRNGGEERGTGPPSAKKETLFDVGFGAIRGPLSSSSSSDGSRDSLVATLTTLAFWPLGAAGLHGRRSVLQRERKRTREVFGPLARTRFRERNKEKEREQKRRALQK